MHTVYVGINYSGRRIKVVADKDCLPTEVHKVVEYVSKADIFERFWHYYDKIRWLEDFGFEICIDLGTHYYETGVASWLAPRKKEER